MRDPITPEVVQTEDSRLAVWVNHNLDTGDGLAEEICPDHFVLATDGLLHTRNKEGHIAGLLIDGIVVVDKVLEDQAIDAVQSQVAENIFLERVKVDDSGSIISRFVDGEWVAWSPNVVPVEVDLSEPYQVHYRPVDPTGEHARQQNALLQETIDQLRGPDPSSMIRELSRQLDDETAIMSGGFEQLDAFQQIIRQGEGALPELLSNMEAPSWWQMDAIGAIAHGMGKPIELPEEIRGKYAGTRDHIIEWAKTHGYIATEPVGE